MKALAHIELTTIKLPNEIQFVAVREDGWVERIAGPTLVAFLLYLAWELQSFWTFVFSAIGLAGLIANWIQGRATKLRVTASELVADGNLEKMFSTETRIAASEVTAIGYEVGYENEPSGLYVKTGLARTCVLPGLNQEQAATVADAIYRRFPKICTDDRSPSSLIFGDQSGLTTLGLSDSQHQRPDSET